MSKRNLGILFILLGTLLLLKKLPLPVDFQLLQNLLPYLAMVGFGIYLLSRKNYQFGLPLLYVGAAYSLHVSGWFHVVHQEYFVPSVLIALGLGFILQGQAGRR